MRVWAVALLAVAFPAQAQTDGAWDITQVRQRVSTLAFDPSRFFGDDLAHVRDLIRITYTGDDWGWPVYSIVIRDVCEKVPGAAKCAKRRVARMLRAPVPPQGAERPRWRGSMLVASLEQKGVQSDAQLAEALDGAGLDWVEADVAKCAGAQEQIARAGDIQWVMPGILRPEVNDDLALVLHADRVKVEFRGFARDSIYDGYAAAGSAGEWAVRLAEVLEPCWQPLAATRPWRLPQKPGKSPQ